MRRLLGALICVAAAAAGGAQPVIGGAGRLETGLLVNPQSFKDSDLDWGLSFAPSLAVQTPEMVFSVEASLAPGGEGAPELTVDLAELRLDPLPFLALRLGRFRHSPGAAELVSPTDYFARQDLVELLTGGVSAAASDLAQLTLFYRDVYLRATVAPFVLEPIVPEPTSPWFPRIGLPSTIDIAFPSERTLLLDKVILEHPLPPERDIENLSVSAEIGASLWVLDMALLYYHGYDNTPLLSARLSFPQGLFGSYDVYLAPVYRVVDALGATAKAGFGAFRLWVDVSLSLPKMLLTHRLDAATLETLSVSAAAVEAVAGVSFEPEAVDLLLLLEGKGLWVNLPNDGYVRPLLSDYAAGTAVLGLVASKVHLSSSTLVSLADGSLGLSGQIAWAPVSEIEVLAGGLFFLGGLRTELGQFRGLVPVWLRLVWRF
jgi:hypothetical protein